MFSIYTSGFNLLKNNFDFATALTKFDSFADDVVIAINTSDDGTEAAVEAFELESRQIASRIRIVKTDFSYDDPDLDGKIKNAALQATNQPFKIGLDLDEYIPQWQYPLWEQYAEVLNSQPQAGSMMIPVVNLYKEETQVKDVGSKWYLHKPGLYRGVVKWAKNEDGTHDITKSDSCELISEEGELVYSLSAVPPNIPTEYVLTVLETEAYPFVVHTGYLNLEDRVLRNVNFWKNHWAVEAGHPVHVPDQISSLEYKSFPHKLRLS